MRQALSKQLREYWVWTGPCWLSCFHTEGNPKVESSSNLQFSKQHNSPIKSSYIFILTCERRYVRKCDKLQLGGARVIVCNGMCKYLCSRLEQAAISNAGAASDNSAWANLALIEQSAEQSDHCRLIIALIQTHFLLFHCTAKSSNPLSSWSCQKTSNSQPPFLITIQGTLYKCKTPQRSKC